MPRASGQVRVEKEVAARDYVESGAFLLGNDDSKRVGDWGPAWPYRAAAPTVFGCTTPGEATIRL